MDAPMQPRRGILEAVSGSRSPQWVCLWQVLKLVFLLQRAKPLLGLKSSRNQTLEPPFFSYSEKCFKERMAPSELLCSATGPTEL